MELYGLVLKMLGWMTFVVVVAVIIDLWAYHVYHNDPDQLDELFDEEPR